MLFCLPASTSLPVLWVTMLSLQDMKVTDREAVEVEDENKYTCSWETFFHPSTSPCLNPPPQGAKLGTRLSSILGRLAAQASRTKAGCRSQILPILHSFVLSLRIHSLLVRFRKAIWTQLPGCYYLVIRVGASRQVRSDSLRQLAAGLPAVDWLPESSLPSVDGIPD